MLILVMILLACSQKDDHNLNKIDDVERSMNDTGTPINELYHYLDQISPKDNLDLVM